MRSARAILLQASGKLPALEQRLDQFADHLLAVCGAESEPAAGTAPPDEVLVVGHSSGAMLAMSVVARALARRPELADASSRLSLLTLGHCTPVLSYQPPAHTFRQEQSLLRRFVTLAWLDVTAPPDACCFALVDPTHTLPASPEPWPSPSHATVDAVPALGPKRLSAGFARMFEAPRYRAIRRDKYRCHFQYLMATDLPVAYDYFAITAGPQRLLSRFATQPGVTRFQRFQWFGRPDAPPADTPSGSSAR